MKFVRFSRWFVTVCLIGVMTASLALAQEEPLTTESFTVAFLLPETASSPRWQNSDKPAFEKAMAELAPNVELIVSSATTGSAASQQRQAEAALTNGADVLVVAAVDSEAAARIVEEANKAGVEVIAYDRLILNSDVAYYVSFNNVKVGELQGQYLADHVAEGGTIVMLNGAPTDNNAKLFAQGAHNVLDPLFESGALVLGYEQFTPNWDASNALSEMEQALTKLSNDVDGVLAANDNLAGGAIRALRAQGMAGEVPVTGQDATNAGLTRIIMGTQGMTVYKNVRAEAEAAAKLAIRVGAGMPIPEDLIDGTINNGMVEVPEVLLTPIGVTKDNIAETVIADGYTTWEEICVGPAASMEPCTSHQ